MPVLQEQFKFDEYICCEEATEEEQPELYEMDVKFGADFIAVYSNKEPLLFSTRVLRGFRNEITLRYASYTSKECEVSKRRTQFKDGSLNRQRYFTVQAFIPESENEVYEIYIARTADIIDYLDAQHTHRTCVNSLDSNIIAVFDIKNLKAAGVPVVTIRLKDYDKLIASQYKVALERLRANYSK